MKRSLYPVAALVLMCAGIGSGCSEERGGARRAGDNRTYTYIDGAFLSGGGFSSGQEVYVAHEGTAALDGAMSRAATAELLENGAHFYRAEFLFLTGAAFYSGPKGYPLSW